MENNNNRSSSPLYPRLVVFDLYGTTIEENGLISRVFEQTLRKHGQFLDPKRLKMLRGKSKAEILRGPLVNSESGIYDHARIHEIQEEFEGILIQTLKQEPIRPIPGSVETFRWLRSSGIRIALTTGFEGIIVEAILSSLNWNRGMFDAVVHRDDVLSGRPAPDLIFKSMERTSIMHVGEVATVGDTTADLMSARSANVGWSFAVLTGAHDFQLLSQFSCTAILNSVADLPEYLRTHVQS